MRRSRSQLLTAGLITIFLATFAALALGQGNNPLYLPVAIRELPTATPTPTLTPTPTPTATSPPPAESVEFRGLWITRFNWTSISQTEQPSDVDQMVDDAAEAGFNALLFQVRGVADAYYDSNVEPWSDRLTGTLGQHPGWDPLAHMIERAHAHGMQVHAYINVYPVWTCAGAPPSTSPQHLYHLLVAEHGIAPDGKPHGLQWTTGDDIHCSGYQRATPASFFVDDHLMAVATDIVSRYDVDGLHLDHIRYGGGNTSCDPVSEGRAGGDCFIVAPDGHASYSDWQRAQVNGTVSSFYDTLFNQGVANKPSFMLSGAVWPYYDSGFSSYYQDSKAWLAGGYIDAIMPMLYGSFDTSPGVWKQYAAGFQSANAGRFVIPGIHGGFYGGEPGTFEDIAQRIEAARQLGTAGHAIFAYNYLAANGFFDDLAAGPYAAPADPPTITWHP